MVELKCNCSRRGTPIAEDPEKGMSTSNRSADLVSLSKLQFLEPFSTSYGEFFRGNQKEGIKRRTFYGQADRGVSAPLALTISKCENFDPFFLLKFDSVIL